MSNAADVPLAPPPAAPIVSGGGSGQHLQPPSGLAHVVPSSSSVLPSTVAGAPHRPQQQRVTTVDSPIVVGGAESSRTAPPLSSLQGQPVLKRKGTRSPDTSAVQESSGIFDADEPRDQSKKAVLQQLLLRQRGASQRTLPRSPPADFEDDASQRLQQHHDTTGGLTGLTTRLVSPAVVGRDAEMDRAGKPPHSPPNQSPLPGRRTESVKPLSRHAAFQFTSPVVSSSPVDEFSGGSADGTHASKMPNVPPRTPFQSSPFDDAVSRGGGSGLRRPVSGTLISNPPEQSTAEEDSFHSVEDEEVRQGASSVDSKGAAASGAKKSELVDPAAHTKLMDTAAAAAPSGTSRKSFKGIQMPKHVGGRGLMSAVRGRRGGRRRLQRRRLDFPMVFVSPSGFSEDGTDLEDQEELQSPIVPLGTLLGLLQPMVEEIVNKRLASPARDSGSMRATLRSSRSVDPEDEDEGTPTLSQRAVEKLGSGQKASSAPSRLTVSGGANTAPMVSAVDTVDDQPRDVTGAPTVPVATAAAKRSPSGDGARVDDDEGGAEESGDEEDAESGDEEEEGTRDVKKLPVSNAGSGSKGGKSPAKTPSKASVSVEAPAAAANSKAKAAAAAASTSPSSVDKKSAKEKNKSKTSAPAVGTGASADTKSKGAADRLGYKSTTAMVVFSIACILLS